jgi:ribonuclease HII
MIMATPVSNQMATDLPSFSDSMVEFMAQSYHRLPRKKDFDERFVPILHGMLKPFYQKQVPEAGCDEAGRGCLAGPVFAGAVILPADFHHPLLNDSKKLSEKDRYMLREVIVREAIAWSVADISHMEIDSINILQASIKAMHKAIDGLGIKPGFLLVDGNRFKPYPFVTHKTFIKGDAEYASIAAASILAKTCRDDHMLSLDLLYPQYGWKQNKGYPTEMHRLAIQQHGLSPYHRTSFQCLPGND